MTLKIKREAAMTASLFYWLGVQGLFATLYRGGVDIADLAGRLIIGDLNGLLHRDIILQHTGIHQTQGESVNILLNFTQFFETRIEYRFQIFTAHSCDFLLPS
ncbi:hypothetical protein, partial [Aeromonas caviae]|uniref:hypothetical protein n=1 Tax=Aeromonas caviae TaxID=648 RepID=UPI001FB9EB1A